MTECKRLQKELGLMDWNIHYRFQSLRPCNHDGHGPMAQADSNAKSRFASVSLDNETQWLSYQDPVMLARHEMSHILLSTLMFYAQCRYLHEDELELEFEKLAQILEKNLR